MFKSRLGKNGLRREFELRQLRDLLLVFYFSIRKIEFEKAINTWIETV